MARAWSQPGRIGSGTIIRASNSAASTAMAPTGRSTAAQMVRVATSTAATSSGRPITPSSITAITSSGVPSIWTCSPGRAALVAVNKAPGPRPAARQGAQPCPPPAAADRRMLRSLSTSDRSAASS